MKKAVAVLFTVLLIPNILYAEETFEGFAARVESWAEGLNGYVVSSSGATIDLGKNANVIKGMEFTTYRDGEALIHPVTGESLGVKKVTTGKIAILSTEEKYSTTTILENKGIKKGDRVEHIFPVPVAFQTKFLQESETAQIKYSLFKSSALKEDESSAYKVLCERENSGSTKAKCSLMFNGSVIFYDNIPVKGVKIITTKKAGIEHNYKVNQQVVSIAAGFFLGKDKEYLTAITDRSSVTFYTMAANDKLVEKYSLSSFRGEVINIEAYDINNNGKDELIVSILDKKNNTVSKIYEYDGKSFKLIHDKIPYLFRSYFTGGKKHLICQTYSEGAMVGMVYKVSYDNKTNNILYTPENTSFGASIYGYGALSDDFLYFSRHGLLSKKYGSSNVSYNNANLGNTVNFIIYTEKLDTGVNVAETGESAGFFVYDEKSVVVPVYQRIIQLSNGSFLVYDNQLSKNNIMGSFKKAQLGAYFLTSSMVKAWQTDIDGTAVTDIDILSDGSTIIYTYSKEKNGIDDIYLDIITSDSF